MATRITHNPPLLLEDVVADILARLPVKSLKRFMSVGKSIYSLIQTPHFISAHYAYSRKNKSSPLIYCQHGNETKKTFLLASNSNRTDLDVVEHVHDGALYFLSFCNGIICLSFYHGDVLLWNPATKESKLVPRFPFEPPEGCVNDIDVVGLGYDSVRDNYKVIRVDSFYNDEYLNNNDAGFVISQSSSSRFIHCNSVTLYDFATDSWRKFQDNFAVEFLGTAVDQFYSNGFYHCVVADENNNVLLFSFDMSNEAFVTTTFPDDSGMGRISVTNYLSSYRLMEINGTVGGIVFHALHSVLDKRYDVWVLGKIGVKHSWTKLYTVGPMFNFFGPVGGGFHGEIFFANNEDGNFVAWHLPSNRQVKILQLEGFFLDMVIYAESLVSLGRRNAVFNH